MYFRMNKNNFLLTTAIKKNKRSNNSIAYLRDGSFIQILSFIVDVDRKEEWTICKRFIISDSIEINCKPLRQCTLQNNDIFKILTKEIQKIYVFMSVKGRNYVSALPNMY